jgi:hypothetical protein
MITITTIMTMMKITTILIVTTNTENVVADIITTKIINTEMNTGFQLLYTIAENLSTE